MKKFFRNLKNLFTKRMSGVDGLVVAIVLVVIAVVLIVAFNAAVLAPMQSRVNAMGSAIGTLPTYTAP